jgi:hypothetical protein
MGKLEPSNQPLVSESRIRKGARTYRDLCVAARDGDRAAIRALLRRHGWPQLADEVRRGKPVSPRVKRQIDAVTCAYGTPWEADLPDPPSPPARGPRPIFDD